MASISSLNEVQGL